MPNKNIFEIIAMIFQKENIKCVLVGGFAVNYYGVTLHTADVDFLIKEDDFEKISVLLKREGFTLDFSNNLFARFKNDKSYFMYVDFLFVDSQTLDKIIKDAGKAEIAGRKFLVPSVIHLIALKLHAIKHDPKVREYKDLSDIIDLVNIKKINVKDARFRDIALKYGTEEIYKKILEKV